MLQRHTNTVSLRHWYNGRLTRYQHWAWRQAHDFFCHAAQEYVLQPSTAMGAHDNEIHLFGLGRFDNFVKRHPVDHGNFPFEPSRGDTSETVVHALRDLCF